MNRLQSNKIDMMTSSASEGIEMNQNDSNIITTIINNNETESNDNDITVKCPSSNVCLFIYFSWVIFINSFFPPFGSQKQAESDKTETDAPKGEAVL